jgi:hypothetical protein
MSLSSRIRRDSTSSLAVAIVAATLFGVPATPEADARERYRTAYASTISGPVDLPDACDGRRAELFPQLVTHPGSPRRLTAIYFQDGQQAAIGASSRSSGRRWTRTPVTSATACAGGPPEREQLVNPLLAGGPGGVAYYGNSWYGKREGLFAYDVTVHRSTAPGLGWTGGAAPNMGTSPVLPGGPYAQNVGVVADPADPKIVHAVWAEFDQVPNPGTYAPITVRLKASTSADRGKTFSDPVTVAEPPPDRYLINARLQLAANGALLAFYDTAQKSELANATVQLEALSSRSNDGGQTWSEPVHVGDPIQFAFTDPDGDGGGAYGSAKFDSATNGKHRAAVVWATPKEDGTSTIEITRSTDAGRSWSEPTTAISVPAHLIQPAVTIGRRGRTGLFWYDTRNDKANDGELTADAWFASSNRSGRKWQTRHLAGPFDLRASYDPEVVAYDGVQGIGVYQDLVTMPRGFGAAYTVGPPLAKDGVTDVEFTRIMGKRHGN